MSGQSQNSLAKAVGPGRNLGIPLFVDTARDLVAKPEAVLDSWYVNCIFQSGEQVIGFEWHQGIMPHASMTEFLLMKTGDSSWRPHTVSEPVSATMGASPSACHVRSSFGTLSGDRSRLVLELNSGNDALSVVLTPQAEELYNGTTGLMPVMGSNSYEYAFPNMIVQGSLTIDGETFAVDGARAWFDRQWGVMPTADEAGIAEFGNTFAQVAWAWIGMTFGPDDRQAISFWNIQMPNGEYATCLTLLRADGIQMNVVAEVTYDKIWTSADTGNRYPAHTHITAPLIDLDLHLEALIERPEFVYRKGSGKSGCQAPCHATGRIGAISIDKLVIFEMLGSVGR